MSEFAHPDKFRFYADFTGADGRRKPGWKPPETAETIESVKADVAQMREIRNGNQND